MSYWTKLKAKHNIPDRPNHPWAELARKSLEQRNAELFKELDDSGQLGAFIDVEVDDCIKRIRALEQEGTDPEAAKEIAFSELFPTEPAEIEDWEEEGGQQDAIDAFSEWIERDSNKTLED